MDESKTTNAGFWDILSVIIKWRRLLIVNFFAAAVVVFIIASFLPKWYASSASIFPPEKETSAMSLSSSLMGAGLGSILSGSGMSLPSFATLSDIYSAVLQSRTVAELVIDENDLMEVYKTESRENALRKLGSHLSVNVGPEGIINVAFEDKDPQRAADIVDSYIVQLNKVNRKIRTARVSATRQFIEERLEQTKIELDKAENDYKDFQLDNKAISLNDQVSAMIDNLAELQSQLVLADIELGVFKQSFLSTHTKVKQQEAKIAEIKKQIQILEKGSPEAESGTLSIPLTETPGLGLELVRLTRSLKIQEAIYELLTQQYEQAKIQEKRDTPTIQILDYPKVPEKKSRPKRATMALLAGMLCFLLTLTTTFFVEFIDRNKDANTETYKRLENICTILKEDFYAVRSVFSKKRS